MNAGPVRLPHRILSVPTDPNLDDSTQLNSVWESAVANKFACWLSAPERLDTSSA
jgi:hypothetical protein